MAISKSILLPLGVVALIGACAPYPPAPQPYPPAPGNTPDEQQALTDEQQRQIDESRERLRQQEEERQNEMAREQGGGTDGNGTKPKYPTAEPIPGRKGFVRNPYTMNIVDVKGIASGKLCRDPEDPNPNHKFRVP